MFIKILVSVPILVITSLHDTPGSLLYFGSTGGKDFGVFTKHDGLSRCFVCLRMHAFAVAYFGVA
jgi:hypothetical protein